MAYFCDGSLDDKSSFLKTLAIAMQHFKKYNLDALWISTYAPGLSAYNKVERRMALLSKVLSGTLLSQRLRGCRVNFERGCQVNGQSGTNVKHAIQK